MAHRSRASALAFALIVGVAAVLSVVGHRALLSIAVVPAGALPAAQVAVAWVFVASGLVALARSRHRRTALLLVATGLALFIRMLRYSTSPVAFTIGFALGSLNVVLMGHAVLSFPDGAVRDRLERLLLALAYVVDVAVPTAALFFFDPTRTCFYCARHASEPRSLLLVSASDRVWNDLSRLLTLSFGVFAVAFVVVLARRLARETPRGRALRVPLAVAAVGFAGRGIAEAVVAFVPVTYSQYVLLTWWEYAAEAAIAIALLAGMLHSRFAQATLAELLPLLAHASPAELESVLARALADPSLMLLLPAADESALVDVRGDPVTAASAEHRAVSRVEDDGELLAVIVHDPSLLQEPDTVATATAAARLALQNLRLTDELRRQIAALGASRARVVAAADTERRRIERNIHDGTQQRLLAIALELRSAERSGDAADLAATASAAVDELQRAVSELRELAQGLHPSILSEEGLDAALESAARRSPVPVALETSLDGRLPPEIESTTYFVVNEGLANIAKHSCATAASVRVRHDDGWLTVEIQDDGVGGADDSGSGIAGLVERVEAHGGRLLVTSPRGRGTRVVGEIPCAS